MSASQRAIVFGGAKGIGLWLAVHVFRESAVTVVDVDAKALDRLPPNITGHLLDGPLTPESDIPLVLADTVVVLATPMHVMRSLGQHVVSKLESCLVIQVASVQVQGEQAIRAFVPASCTYLGMHPMFGPAVAAPVGQIVTLTSFEPSDERHQSFRSSLGKLGLITTLASAREHDEAMQYVQVLTHFTLLAFAQALSSRKQTLRSLSRFRTPPFQFVSAFMGRLLKSAPATVMGIQSAEHAAQVRELFIEGATALDLTIKKYATAPENLIEAFETLREPFAGEEIDEAVTVSSVGIDGLQRFESMLHQHRLHRRVFFARHRDTQRLIIGVIDGIDADQIVLRSAAIPVATEQGQRYAVAFDATAVRNYSKRGIGFPTVTPIVLKKRKLLPLTAEERDEWVRQNVLYVKHRQSFSNPRGLRDETIERVVHQFIPDVVSCQYLEGYTKRGRPQNVTLDLSLLPWASVENICLRIQSLLDGS